MTRRVAAATAATMALGLGACSGGAADSAPDHLRLAYAWYPTCFDNTQSNPYSLFARQVVDTLLSQDPKTGDLQPYLATAWKTLDGGRAFDFTVRDGVTFSNGERLDAQVVAANLERTWELGEQGAAPTPAAYLRGFESARATDDSTVRVEFSQPNAGFLQSTTESQLGIVAPASLKLDAKQRCTDGTIGSGPFVLTSKVQDEKLEYARRAGYDWAPESYGRQGPAALRRLTIQIVPEESVRAAGVISGDYDLGYSIYENGLEQAKGDDTVKPVLAPNQGVVNSLVLNTSDPVLSDSDVRRALQVGIDREELVSTFFGPDVEPATDVVSTGHPAYTDHHDLLRHDPQESQRLLDQAGWTKGKDGVRSKDGRPLRLALTISDSYADDYIEYLQSQLGELGFDIRLQKVSDAELADRRSSGRWQVAIYQGAARGDADGIAAFYAKDLSTWGSALAPQPRLDALLAQEARTIDPRERQQVVDRAVDLVLGDAYGIPLYDSAQVVLERSDVRGLTFPRNAWEPILYSVTKSGQR